MAVAMPLSLKDVTAGKKSVSQLVLQGAGCLNPYIFRHSITPLFHSWLHCQASQPSECVWHPGLLFIVYPKHLVRYLISLISILLWQTLNGILCPWCSHSRDWMYNKVLERIWQAGCSLKAGRLLCTTQGSTPVLKCQATAGLLHLLDSYYDCKVFLPTGWCCVLSVGVHIGSLLKRHIHSQEWKRWDAEPKILFSWVFSWFIVVLDWKAVWKPQL